MAAMRPPKSKGCLILELLREENAWIVDISALFNNIPAVMVIAMTEGTLTRRFSALLTSRLPCA